MWTVETVPRRVRIEVGANFALFYDWIRVKVLKTGLDLGVDPFQCKRDVKWIRSSVDARKYRHCFKLDPYPFGSVLV